MSKKHFPFGAISLALGLVPLLTIILLLTMAFAVARGPLYILLVPALPLGFGAAAIIKEKSWKQPYAIAGICTALLSIVFAGAAYYLLS